MPISRAALAETTGLNKSTVSSLVNELIGLKFVREVGTIANRIGRPSVQLELNPAAGFSVSAEIGVGFISVICADFTAAVLWRHKEATNPESDQQAILSRAFAVLRQAIAVGGGLTGGSRLLGIAIGVPGLVDLYTGTLLFAPNLGWRDVPIKTHLQDAFPQTTVFVDNEANMAAIGEYFFGGARGYDEILYLSAGVGLGGAVVRGGQLLRGVTGYGSEFGHMTLYPDGLFCNCGNRGCWETGVSQSALFRSIRDALADGQTSVLGTMLDRLTIQAVYEAAEAGDPVALAAMSQLGRELGIGIASLVNVLNPDLVLFGGMISVASKFLLPVLQSEVRRRALHWCAEAVTIAPAQHGSDACVMGGMAMIYQGILSQPAYIGNRSRVAI